MKKNCLKKLAALVLAFCMLTVGLPLNAHAAISGNSYAAIISSLWETAGDSNVKNAFFYDLDGSGTEELVLLFMDYSSGYGQFCFSVYAYKNGSVKPVATAVKFDTDASKADGWLGACYVSGQIYFTVYKQNGIVEADGALHYSENWEMYSFDGATLKIALTAVGRNVTRNGVKKNNHYKVGNKVLPMEAYESWKSSIGIMDMIRYHDEADYSYLLDRARGADRGNQALTGTNTQFSDVPSWAYYADAVNWAVKNGITSGVSAASFGPDQVCTRSQAVTFLFRAAGSPNYPGFDGGFADNRDRESYYYHAVNWAFINKIASGTSTLPPLSEGVGPTGYFSPNQACTRAQIVTFLWRAAGEPEPISSYNPFYDVPSNSYYGKAVLWAVENNITAGTGDSRFSPDSPCTRGQIVTFLYRRRYMQA